MGAEDWMAVSLRQGGDGGGTDACRGCSFKFVQTDEIQEEAGLVSLLTFKEDTSSEIQS